MDNMSSSMLTFIVLGSSNLFGRIPNGPLITAGLTPVPLINQDPMQFKAALYNYTYSPGIGAHKVRSTLKTWNAARKACEEDGGHLLIINSDAESRVVVQLLHTHDLGKSWVGIHDYYDESVFVTIHGESLRKAGFDEWAPGEPNNTDDNENCGIVTPAGKLNDINCQALSSYICELSYPDGVSIAQGPLGQGCRCENTEFKCCTDGITPAQGPNYAGCTCDSSKYGCCPDGIEEAQGESFEGCLTVISPPGAACALEKDRGSCWTFTVEWYFDTKTGGCSRFWYGGCEGNDNRFKSQEECEDVCVEPKGRGE